MGTNDRHDFDKAAKLFVLPMGQTCGVENPVMPDMHDGQKPPMSFVGATVASGTGIKRTCFWNEWLH